jgi:hypothetical protein
MKDSRHDRLPSRIGNGIGGFNRTGSRTVCQHLPADPLSVLGVLDDLLAAVETAGTDVVTQMGFSGRWFHSQWRIRQEIMRTAHVTP